MRALHYTALFAVLLFATAAQSTWKPDYAKNPPAVTQWFKGARFKGTRDQNGGAWMEPGICGCCELPAYQIRGGKRQRVVVLP